MGMIMLVFHESGIISLSKLNSLEITPAMNNMLILNAIPARCFPNFKQFNNVKYFVGRYLALKRRTRIVLIASYVAHFGLYIFDKCCLLDSFPPHLIVTYL